MREFVDLGRHDEITLREAIDLVRPDLDLDFSPGEVNIRMVPLLFSQSAREIHKLERLGEVGELEFLLDVVLTDNGPPMHLVKETSQFTPGQRRNTALAWHTDLFREFSHINVSSAEDFLIISYH